MKKRKERASVIHGIVYGKDGPTSVFIAGRRKKLRLSERIKRTYYRYKRQRTEKKITADPHTLEEVTEYIKRIYGAREISTHSYNYQERYKGLRTNLIVQYKPELLGEFSKVKKPRVYNETSLKRFWNRMEQQRKIAESISDTEFPMKFHMYKIKVSKSGEMRICMDMIWNVLDYSCSGDQKDMKQLNHILKDVYRYYGVTKEDIETRSKRYSSLVTSLSTH